MKIKNLRRRLKENSPNEQIRERLTEKEDEGEAE